MARVKKSEKVADGGDGGSAADKAVVTVVRPVFAETAQLTLRQAAAYVGVKPGRIRKLMTGENPKIHGVHEEIEGTGIKVWRVPFAEIKDFAAEVDEAKASGAKSPRKAREGGVRADGKQYVLRLNQEQFAKLRPLIEAEGAELESRYRSRETRKAKKVAQAAIDAENGTELAADDVAAETPTEDELQSIENEAPESDSDLDSEDQEVVE